MGSLSGTRRLPGVPLLLACAAAVALAALVASLLLTGAGPEPAPAGLRDAGLPAAWGLRVARLLFDLAAVLTVGCALTGGVLLRSEPGGALGTVARGTLRAAGWCAAAWAVTAAASFVLAAADLTGTSPTQLSAAALRVTGTTPQGQALLAAAFLAAVVAVAARQVRSAAGAVVLVAVTLAGLLPVGTTGHATTATDHDVAVSGLVVHVAAAALWVGGLAGLLLLLRRAPSHLPGAAHRFSALALVAFLALGGSGVLVALTRLSTSASAWTSAYGALVLAKISALVLLGLLGLAHRRRTLPRLAAGRGGAFLQLAAGELVLMAAATGVAAALTRTPAPPLPVPTDPTHGGGHSTLPARIDPVSLGELVTAWRVNAILALVFLLGLAVYVAGVRALRRRGSPWPRRRTAAFTAGAVLGVVVTCSGVATYAPAMVSVQIAQLLGALVPVPVLLALGAPLTLWLRLRGPARDLDHPPPVPEEHAGLLRMLSDPFVGAGLACVLLLGLYRSALIEVSLRNSWVHLLVLLVAVVAGLLLFWPVLGTDPAPGARSRGETAVAVTGVVACLGLLAAQLRSGDQLLAGVWFLELRWSWVDPVADQRLGGSFAGAAAVALAVLAAVALGRPRGRLPGSRTGERAGERPTASADSAPGRSDGPPARV